VKVRLSLHYRKTLNSTFVLLSGAIDL